MQYYICSNCVIDSPFNFLIVLIKFSVQLLKMFFNTISIYNEGYFCGIVTIVDTVSMWKFRRIIAIGRRFVIEVASLVSRGRTSHLIPNR